MPLPLPPVGQRPATPLNPDRAYLLEFARLQKNFVRGDGCWLTDDTGRRFLDLNAQYGAVPLGHSPEALWAAVAAAREEQLPILVQPAVAPAARVLAERLLSLSPGRMKHVTFCCTGAETVESAIKLVRAGTGKPHILSLDRGYHGKTLGALSATARAEYQAPFFLPLPHFSSLPFGDIDALRRTLDERDDVAALFVEIVQGEGGMRPLPPGYLREAAALCRARGVRLVVDEVQTGLGRTGALFACEDEGIEPDVLLLSKALGGGLFPLGAMLCTADAWSQQFGMHHSSTFANHALACRVGAAFLDVVTAPGFLEDVRRRARKLREGLEELARTYPHVVKDVTGRGLMLSLVIDGEAFRGDDSLVLSAMVQEGTLAPFLCGHLVNAWGVWVAPLLSTDNALRIEPPLVIADEEIEIALDALRGMIDALDRRDVSALLRDQLGDDTKPTRTQRFTPPNPRPPSVPAEPHELVHRFAFFASRSSLTPRTSTTSAAATHRSPIGRRPISRSGPVASAVIRDRCRPFTSPASARLRGCSSRGG